MKVLKYQLNNIIKSVGYMLYTSSHQTIEIPKGAIIISLQVQNDIPTLWVLADESKPTVDRLFMCVFTGEEIGFKNHSFIGTLQLDLIGLVVHVFEVFEVPAK